MNMMQSYNKKIAISGLLVACGIIFGYLEYLFPLPIGIPGVKIGFSNIITLISLYTLPLPLCLCIIFLRIIISGALFGNFFGIIYSLSGAIFAFIFMLLFKKYNIFSIIGLSILGGVVHNTAQLFVAYILVSQIKIIYYLPVLLISGIVCGFIVGYISDLVLKRIKILIIGE